ncbi:hypothetical protein ABPG75_002279 [Micractinium tetrahymenae]
MDLALRTLREGRADPGSPAPLLLLRDALAVVGGPALLRHAVSELAAAIVGGRAAAAALTIVSLQRPAWHYQQLCGLSGALDLTVVDCFADPYGWGSLAPRSQGGGIAGDRDSSASNVAPLPGLPSAGDGLQQLQQRLLGGSSGSSGGSDGHSVHAQQRRQSIIVFDSLSPLLDAFSPTAVAQLLSRLAAHPSTAGLLCGLHADLHPPAVPAVVEQLAAGSLSLLPASDLERSVCAANHGRAPQGRVEARLRRRTGRVRAESQLYCIDGSGAVAFLEPPPDLRNPAAAAEKAAAAAAAAGNGALAQQLAGGMKLSLSREEEEARQRVQLPFEHQGQGAAYQTGDWLDYLPPEAGGRSASRPGSAAGAAKPAPAAAAAGQQPAGQQAAAQGQQQQGQQQGQLGRILYVRDSGSELDSDEDPDDDLDI